MVKVLEYKEVNIYFNPYKKNGLFFCNPSKNDGEYNLAKFKSEKLSSIKKAIDSFSESDAIGQEYINVCKIGLTLSNIKVKSIIGERIFFEDGTDSKSPNRKIVLPVEGNFENISSLKKLREEIMHIEQEIAMLYIKKRDTLKKAETVIKSWEFPNN